MIHEKKTTYLNKSSRNSNVKVGRFFNIHQFFKKRNSDCLQNKNNFGKHITVVSLYPQHVDQQRDIM